MEVTFSHAWLGDFIRKRGGALNVAWRMVCMG